MSVNHSEEKTSDGFSEKVVFAAALYASKWKEGRYSSRRIVKEVGNAVGKGIYGVLPCAALLALENRIAERYATLLNTLLHYFAWKRERRLLASLKGVLRIPERVTVARYVRTLAVLGEEGGGGEPSGDGKKEKDKENKEELSAKESGDWVEIKEEERKESLSEEAEEAEPGKKPIREDKEVSKEALREKSDESPSETPSEKLSGQPSEIPSEQKEAEKGREEAPRRTDGKELPKGVSERVERMEMVKKKQTSDERVPLSDLPLESYGLFGQKGGADSSRYEHYNRPAEVIPPKAPFDAVEEKAGKEGVPADRVERKFSEKPWEASAEKTSHTDRPAVKEELSEENKARIQAREEFAKMSEEELTAVQKAMQECLNREMEGAEQSGEIYKMPITVKEAFEKSYEDRSAKRDSSPTTETVVKK